MEFDDMVEEAVRIYEVDADEAAEKITAYINAGDILDSHMSDGEIAYMFEELFGQM